MTAIAWVAVAVFVAVYVLIATEWVHRVAAVFAGAGIMLAIGATDAEHAFFSEEAGIDWNGIMLLIGMMLIVAVLRRTGLFEYLAIWSVKRARGRACPVMVILVLSQRHSAGQCALVVARPGGRPGRQRHGHRRLGECRRTRSR